MTPPLVSIVIPVFNVERHLRQCLDSVLRQTLKEWECICIDDGSPDGSGAILDEYGNRDARFKIIHQRNRGVSAARNLGIKLASAPYLTFIDSDDWVEDDALESLLSAMKESCADMVMCSICIHQENHQEVSMETPYPPSGNMRDEYAVTEKSFSGAALVDVSIWAKLFSAETFAPIKSTLRRNSRYPKIWNFPPGCSVTAAASPSSGNPCTITVPATKAAL